MPWWHKGRPFEAKTREGKTMEKIRLTVEDLPDLDTEVAISGSVKQQEVWGVGCIFVLGGIALYMSL
jgi:hypothetical protein